MNIAHGAIDVASLHIVAISEIQTRRLDQRVREVALRVGIDQNDLTHDRTTHTRYGDRHRIDEDNTIYAHKTASYQCN